MSKSLLSFTARALLLAAICWNLPVASAQHHGGGHGGGNSGGHRASSGHGLGLGFAVGGNHGISASAHHVVPQIDRHHSGNYYVQKNQYYYRPQPYVATQAPPQSYTVAKPVQMEFGSFAHVDDLSGRLVTLTNEMCLDMHHNYQRNPDYAQAYRMAYQILDTARYINDKQHQGDRTEVARRLAELDPLTHEVLERVRGWRSESRRQIGDRELLAKLDYVDATLHHLMYDAGVKQAPQQGAPGPGAEQAPPPVSSGSPAPSIP